MRRRGIVGGSVRLMHKRYWNEIETFSAEELDRLEGPLIAEQLAYSYACSPLYRAKFDAARICPERIHSKEALAAVPFTEKSEITAAERAGALFGPYQCAAFEDIVRIVGTGGTSGQPTRIGWTASDANLYSEMGARALWANGRQPGDFAVNCFNVLELTLLTALVAGVARRCSYGLVWLLHALSTLAYWRKYLHPFAGEHMLFFAAWPMLAACVALYALRDADSLTVQGWRQRNRARERT